jgi:hypothetical protein
VFVAVALSCEDNDQLKTDVRLSGFQNLLFAEKLERKTRSGSVLRRYCVPAGRPSSDSFPCKMHFAGRRQQRDLSWDKSENATGGARITHAMLLSQGNAFAGFKLDILSTPILLENLTFYHVEINY